MKASMFVGFFLLGNLSLFDKILWLFFSYAMRVSPCAWSIDNICSVGIIKYLMIAILGWTLWWLTLIGFIYYFQSKIGLILFWSPPKYILLVWFNLVSWHHAKLLFFNYGCLSMQNMWSDKSMSIFIDQLSPRLINRTFSLSCWCTLDILTFYP